MKMIISNMKLLKNFEFTSERKKSSSIIYNK